MVCTPVGGIPSLLTSVGTAVVVVVVNDLCNLGRRHPRYGWRGRGPGVVGNSGLGTREALEWGVDASWVLYPWIVPSVGVSRLPDMRCQLTDVGIAVAVRLAVSS